MGLLLLGAGVTGAFMAFERAHWLLGLASVGVLVLAAVYIGAAVRGRPL
jgi:hypothetical protein